ncbi:hypothetical protein B0J12DRAFT_81723 [Macrophomina phaseolina]|uniref:Uncharacterized protein n=1 Tax=Macrophomina phaseolina TaxID=35725 RepID=A0ABQ8GC34_9PEZI|nr:hypothetical protein B0J12DRAFT_81723 [Macrophomina phaseolina]
MGQELGRLERGLKLPCLKGGLEFGRAELGGIFVVFLGFIIKSFERARAFVGGGIWLSFLIYVLLNWSVLRISFSHLSLSPIRAQCSGIDKSINRSWSSHSDASHHSPHALLTSEC